MTKPTSLQAIDPPPSPENTETSDPFNLENLRLDQSFVETASVRKLLRTIPVHKPNPQDFVRCHASPDYRMNAPVIELKDEREEYVITKELVPELVGEFINKTLFTAINRQGVIFLWPVRLPDPEGESMEWWRSNREAAEVFVSERLAPLSVAGYQRMVARAGEAAGFPFLVHSHMLRHSCGYKLANDGQDTRAIQHYLGHKSINSTVRYTALAPDRFKGFWKD
jgi:hypothetical protein